MTSKLAIQRTLAAHLLIALSFGLNLCVVEGAFAGDVFTKAEAAQPSNHDCGHHTDNESKDKSGDEDQACCSNFLAVPAFLKSTFSSDQAVKVVSTTYPFIQTVRDFSRLHGDYVADFSPGESPPTLFLSSRFTHAPPVIS